MILIDQLDWRRGRGSDMKPFSFPPSLQCVSLPVVARSVAGAVNHANLALFKIYLIGYPVILFLSFRISVESCETHLNSKK